MRLALFQPDIPQNVGAIIRLAACLHVPLEIIEPCGFPLSDRSLKRAALDYQEHANVSFAPSWDTFRLRASKEGARLVLLTTKAGTRLDQVAFAPDDIILAGRETAGVPDEVHQAADIRVRIPMAQGRRSLNVATASAIVISAALTQTGQWPEDGVISDQQ